jgi:hypothetical protein
MDLTPAFNSPYSDNNYNSPSYGVPGPNGDYVRTYTNATTYTNIFSGRQAQIAVMGPNIDSNIAYFDFSAGGPQVAGLAAQTGQSLITSLGDFKLFASHWSPAPWLKLVSGNTYSGGGADLPATNSPFPFIWLGNFSGGVLDTTGAVGPEFDDSALGGTGPTSALTQFARCTAAYLRGFQNAYGVSFYAISIQNELDFEEFYNSCLYPLAPAYLAALKAVRAELDRYPDLAGIQIIDRRQRCRHRNSDRSSRRPELAQIRRGETFLPLHSAQFHLRPYDRQWRDGAHRQRLFARD